MDLSSKKVAIIVYNYFEQAEFEKPLQALKDAAAEVHVVSASGETALQAMNEDVHMGDTFTADLTLEQADLAAYDAIVLPGGTVNADNLRTVTDIYEPLRIHLAAGKPLAVICHAPWVLISADIAKGRKLTSFPSLRQDLENAGAEWLDEEVVIDNTVITSRNPDDLPAFCSALIASLQ